MLAFVSDLHLTDGSTAANVHESAFQLLGEEIKSAAEKKGAKEIHVVLLGDIVDLVRTDWWHRQGISETQRPWGGVLDPETGMNKDSAAVSAQFSKVLDGVLTTQPAEALFSMIKQLPAASGRDVRVTYVIGNHDRVLNNVQGLQQRVRERLHPIALAFANKVALPEYGILARHGHEWDENCHGWQFMKNVLRRNRTAGIFDPLAYRVMAIGEVVTAELMSGLVYHTAAKLDLKKSEDRLFLDLVKDVNNLRPMTDVLKWIGWAMRGQARQYLKIAGGALAQALEGLLNCSLARRWDEIKPGLLVFGDITDWLGRALKILQKDGLASLTKEASTLANIKEKLAAGYSILAGKGEQDHYAASAAEDLEMADSWTRFVVYGHTHRAVWQGMPTAPGSGSRVYLNMGTYLPLIDRTSDGKSYWRAHRMAMLMVYRDDEDMAGRAGPGPTLDVWDGVRLKDYVDQAKA